MKRSNLKDKRQLLTDLFTGNTKSLQAYKVEQQPILCTYRWAIENTVERIKYLVNLDGTRKLLTNDEFEQLPDASKFVLVDYSRGLAVPAPDEV